MEIKSLFACHPHANNPFPSTSTAASFSFTCPICCKFSFIPASFFPRLPRWVSFLFPSSIFTLTHLSFLRTVFATINFWLQCNHLPSSPRDPGSRSLWNAACKDPSSPPLWLWVHVWLAHACCQLPLPNWNWDASGLCFCLHCTPGGDTLPTSPHTHPSRGLLFMPSSWEKLSFPWCVVKQSFTWTKEMAPSRSQPTAGKKVVWFTTVNKSTV